MSKTSHGLTLPQENHEEKIKKKSKKTISNDNSVPNSQNFCPIQQEKALVFSKDCQTMQNLEFTKFQSPTTSTQAVPAKNEKGTKKKNKEHKNLIKIISQNSFLVRYFEKKKTQIVQSKDAGQQIVTTTTTTTTTNNQIQTRVEKPLPMANDSQNTEFYRKLTKGMQILDENVNFLNSEVKKMKSERLKTENEHQEEKKKLENEISELNKQLESLNSKIEETAQQLDDSTSKNFELNKQNSELSKQNVDFRTFSHFLLINSWISESLLDFQFDKEWKLVYKATKDGFSAENFHQKCDNLGKPTICLIKSDNGSIFGGFTTVDWDSFSGYKHDQYAFVFSLVNPKIPHRSMSPVKIPVKNCALAIYCGKIFGAHFGNAIEIFDNADVSDNKSDVRKETYDIGESYSAKEGKEYLCGSQHGTFKAKEIEVYVVI